MSPPKKPTKRHAGSTTEQPGTLIRLAASGNELFRISDHRSRRPPLASRLRVPPPRLGPASFFAAGSRTPGSLSHCPPAQALHHWTNRSLATGVAYTAHSSASGSRASTLFGFPPHIFAVTTAVASSLPQCHFPRRRRNEVGEVLVLLLHRLPRSWHPVRSQ